MTAIKNIVLLTALATAGCTTTTYVAQTDVDLGDKECTLQTSWTSTYTPFYGRETDQSLSVRLGGHSPVTYKKQGNRYIYTGMKGDDVKTIGQPPTTPHYECGTITGLDGTTGRSENALQISMHCEKVLDPLSRIGYLPAMTEPYVLQVSHQRLFSFTGAQLEAPQPPRCRTKTQ